MSKTRGKIIMVATALGPIRHGGAVVGNVQQFRRHEVFHEDGTRWSVPFISGNSVKNFIRRNAASFALEAMGVSGGMSRAEVQLIFSGGSLTAKGSSVRLDKARDASRAFPVLGLCGYSAGNTMTESQVRVDNLELVCAETANTLASRVKKYAPEHASKLGQYSSDFVQVWWGTRHEPTRRRNMLELISDEEQGALIAEQSSLEKKGKGDSLQMMYEFETLAKGSVLVGGFSFPMGVTEDELQAFRSAFVYASEGVADDGGLIIHLGGGSSTGMGKFSVKLFGLLAEGIKPLQYQDTDKLAPSRDIGDEYDEAMQAYVERLSGRGGEVIDLLGGVL